MKKRRIKRVPVLHGKKVVGIVTRSDLMHAMVSLARAEPKAAKDDATIRQKLLAESSNSLRTSASRAGTSRKLLCSARRCGFVL